VTERDEYKPTPQDALDFWQEIAADPVCLRLVQDNLGKFMPQIIGMTMDVVPEITEEQLSEIENAFRKGSTPEPQSLLYANRAP